MKILSILGYNIFDGLVSEITSESGEKIIVNTINPHSYVVAKKDKLFNLALLNSNYLLADGIGIVFASYVLRLKRVARINGPTLFDYLIKKSNIEHKKVFFLGASEETLNIIGEKLRQEYPNVQADFFSPPFKSSFSRDDSNLMIKKVNEFRPDILFVGMTAPKQEKWVYENQDKLKAKMICSIGAVFDFYAGTVKMPNQFWVKLRLIWLIRFLKDPKKLWRRNLVSMPIFLSDVLLAALKLNR